MMMSSIQLLLGTGDMPGVSFWPQDRGVRITSARLRVVAGEQDSRATNSHLIRDIGRPRKKPTAPRRIIVEQAEHAEMQQTLSPRHARDRQEPRRILYPARTQYFRIAAEEGHQIGKNRFLLSLPPARPAPLEDFLSSKALDGSLMNAHRERSLDTLYERRIRCRWIFLQLVEQKPLYFGSKLARLLWPAFLVDQTNNTFCAKYIDRGVERLSRVAELATDLGDGDAFNEMQAQHLVLHLHFVPRIEEVALVE
jgi:hypothetical protein